MAGTYSVHQSLNGGLTLLAQLFHSNLSRCNAQFALHLEFAQIAKKTQLINPLLKDQMNQSETISPGQGPLTHVKHGKAGNGLLEVLWRMTYPGTWKSHCLSGTTISNQSDTVPPPPLCINEAGNLAFAGCRSRHFLENHSGSYCTIVYSIIIHLPGKAVLLVSSVLPIFQTGST